MSRLGISVAICTHNGAARLPATLSHLKKQDVPADLEWEVVVVDNASTDKSGAVARQEWKGFSAVPLRVVDESRLGLSHARHCALETSRFDLLALVDDDNWLSPGWVAQAVSTMAECQEIAACGGPVDPVFETSPPSWFGGLADGFAVGEQGKDTSPRGFLWGAGLVVRKSSWCDLNKNGFVSELSDRKGRSVSAGGDAELCYALQLAGWELKYVPTMRLEHFIPATRLTWDYACRVSRGNGVASVVHDAYRFALGFEPQQFRRRYQRIWGWQAAAATKAVAFWKLRNGSPFWKDVDQARNALVFEFFWGRLRELLRQRNEYDERLRSIPKAAWVKQKR